MTNTRIVNGEIVYDGSRHSDYLFRVSLKAVIIDNDGRVLVVKETGRDWWDIPGGGLDHGETIAEALARELREEVSLQGEFDYQVILVEDPRYLSEHNLYQTRITFIVTPRNFAFGPGDDSDEVMFVDPSQFKDSDVTTERKIYEYTQLAIKSKLS
jgi:8-oxo-dGTP diphosphatase